MLVEKTITLEQSDLDYLHDVTLEVFDKSLSDEEVIEIWKSLPDDIKLDAEKFGISDTVVRDNIYEFLEGRINYEKSI
jgi:hypothetical protein